MYEKQIWKDRSIEKPLTYYISNNEDGTITLTPCTGEVYEEGSKHNAQRMNYIESGVEEVSRAIDEQTSHKYILKLTSAVSAGGTITIPCKYKVGSKVLDVYLNGQKLLLSSDDAGTDGHYREVGTAGNISNQIKLTSDWGIPQASVTKGRVFEFVVRGEYE